jgi:hypothetical protein
METENNYGIHAEVNPSTATITISRDWLGSLLGILYQAEKRLKVSHAHHDEQGKITEAIMLKWQLEMVDQMVEAVTDRILDTVPKKKPSTQH